MFKRKQQQVIEQPKPKRTVLQWAESLAYDERTRRMCARKGCGYEYRYHEPGYYPACPEFLDITEVNKEKK